MTTPEYIDSDALAIGDWWAPCCLHDLSQIQTADDLEAARGYIPYSGGWHTLREAVAYFLDPDQFRCLGDERERAQAEEEAYARATFPDAFVSQNKTGSA